MSDTWLPIGMKTMLVLRYVLLFFIAVLFAASIYVAYREKKKYSQDALRLIELASEMKEEEEYLKDRSIVLIFRSNSSGRWYGKRVNGTEETRELRGVSDAMPVEDIYKAGRRRYANFEVAIAACVACGTLADSADGTYDGKPVEARYEFKKNSMGFNHAYGAYICRSCGKKEY